METLVLALDLFGTFVFALSGAMVGVRAPPRHFRRARAVLRRW